MWIPDRQWRLQLLCYGDKCLCVGHVFPSLAAALAHLSLTLLGMVCKDSNFKPKAPRNATCHASPQVHLESPCVISRHGMIVLRWSFMQSIACHHLLGGHTRGMCMRAQKKALKKKKKKTRRSIIKKLKQIRYIAKIKKHCMNREEKLLARIERAKRKKEVLETALKKYELPPSPPAKHDPESLTPEELHYLQRLGYKHKNYFNMGVRGIFGGVILNMHLHWKKHQLVKVRCKNFTKEEIQETGEELARLSGGMVIDVQKGNTIVMYRGKNYTRPRELTPKNTLTKRKALFKARYEQSLESVIKNIEATEKELALYREQLAKEGAQLLGLDSTKETHPSSDGGSASEHTEVLESGADEIGSTPTFNSEDTDSNMDTDLDSDSNMDTDLDSEADFASELDSDSDQEEGATSDSDLDSDYKDADVDTTSSSDEDFRW